MTITEPVVAQFINSNLQNVDTRENSWFATCPFCSKKKNHFNVYKIGIEYRFKCYSCGKKGKFEFLMRSVLGYNVNIKKVVEDYSGGITLSTLLQLYDKDVSLSDMFFNWDDNTVLLTSQKLVCKRAVSYLASRNIDLKLALELGIKVGVDGKYKNMLVIPVYFENEAVNLIARQIPPYVTKERYSGPNKGEAIKDKSELLYNFDDAKGSDWVVICEGAFDTIALKSENIPVVGLMGKSMSQDQLLLIIENWDEVFIMLDAGFLEDALKIARLLEGLTTDVKICILGADKDPSDDTENAVSSIGKARSLEYF